MIYKIKFKYKIIILKTNLTNKKNFIKNNLMNYIIIFKMKLKN